MEIKELEEQNRKLTKLADSMQNHIQNLKDDPAVPSVKKDIKWLQDTVKENLAIISIMRNATTNLECFK